MTELFENIVSVLCSEQATRALSDELRIDSADTAGSAAELCVPVVLVNLHHAANEAGRGPIVLAALRSVETTGLTDPEPTIRGGLYEPFGSELVQTLLGGRREKVAGVIAAGAGISERSAQWLLSPVAWAVMASIADRYGNHLTEQPLLAVLKQESVDLLDGGWEPWLEATGELNVAATTDEHRAIQTVARDTGADRIQASGKYPPPVKREQRTTVGDSQLEVSRAGFDPVQDTPPLLADQALVGQPTRDTSLNNPDPLGERRGGTDDDLESHGDRFSDLEHRGPRGPRLPIVFMVALAAVLGALFWLFMFRNDAPPQESATDSSSASDGSTNASDAPSTTLEPAGQSGAEEESGDATTGDDTSTASSPEGSSDGVVRIEVMMADPLERTDATGLAELRLDPEAGEICYNLSSERFEAPYDTHIHVGPAGTKGPIVVDFGSLSNGDIGCITVTSTEIDAIIANRAGHYYEIHEPSSEITIRGQLSGDVETAPTPNSIFDPTGGGARTVVETGRITLRGSVADQATVDLLTQEFSTVDLEQTELVNELRVVEGSPAPSGLIEVNDEILFAVGSSDLEAVEGTVIEDLANLFRARPDWTMAIVGHTDNSGSAVDNLELSLSRADAVRIALIDLGVDGDNLRTQGAGDTQPIFSNQSDAGRARNRRIEFRVDPPSR